ncbi:MAG: bifunctional [glutamate--ammonia ligase]-adenylyl-L-tyrosine phosphorylase/[glutamate--ammonia-ligase] adenylyltransferase [Desulfomonilaceae bacterium]
METAPLLYIKTNCPRLWDFLSGLPAASREQLSTEILDTPNFRVASGRIEDLLAGDVSDEMQQLLADASVRSPLLATVAGSRFLFSILHRNNVLLDSLFQRKGYLIRKTRPLMESDLRSRIKDIPRTADLDRALRWYKEEEYLRIGTRDLARLAAVPEVMAELSDLAGTCIQVALEFHWQRLVAKHGPPPDVGDQMGLVVLGMGKISGRELNFSSDVDLIFLRGPEEGRTDGPEPRSVARFYETLVRSVTHSLSDATEDGFVFRLDLRLRPEGERGELVPSVSNALDYYLGWGRTWERAALMKAVPLAGDLSLGKTFIRELEPFIYRKHLDYSTLEDMRLMKLRIETQLKRKPGINIKLGQGGIREIEFFVQALQLINGGKTPRVRSAGTLEALSLLREAGLLDKVTMEKLREAYLFFRRIEHCIQINHQLQTHELPRTVDEQEELARRLGYRKDALKTFLLDLERGRKAVEELFSSLFRSEDDVGTQVSPAVKRLIEAVDNEKRAVAVLAELGFDDPAASYPVLKNLVTPSDSKIESEKGRHLLERLAPLFLEELLKAPEPGRTLIALDSYIDSLHFHTTYFATLLENPPTIKFIVKILGESRFFTDLLIRHPQSIDSLIARGAQDYPKEKESLETELAERLAYCSDLESELDVLRIFKNDEMLVIGVRHLSDDIESTVARKLVTDLAEVCLQGAVEIALKEMGRKFGTFDFFETLPFVILGMGKLGGMEMTYLSDLDVIFIYDPPSEQIGRFSSHEWFTRLANRIISILSVPTSEGTVFAIDARLRPSGNKGPLVSSLSSFRDYHRSTSQLWEKQALIKARPVTGQPRLIAEAAQIVRDCIVRTELSDEGVREIAKLRRRMESELALEDDLHVDLKTGHGGLVDVEFFVQANILKHAARRPDIIRNNTLEALAALHSAELLDEGSFRTLDSSYRFLISLEDRLRIMEHRSVDRLPLGGDKLKGLAWRLGYGDRGEDRLLNDYFRITGSIRKIYNSFFAAADDRVTSAEAQ